MKFTVCVLAALAASALAAGEGKEPWRDPTVRSINRLPARAVAVPCESAELALKIAKGEAPREASKWLESLNGEWDFKWKGNIGEDWAKSGRIKVPGCWQLQGEYDPANYTNLTYPIRGWQIGDPTVEPPKEYTSYGLRTPVGLYSRTFALPADWKGRRVVIHFGGVSSAMYVRLNGKEVGYSEDSRLPAEFDLTPFLADGENALEVEVLKHSDGSFLEDQDFWRLSGIFRDVWLVAEQPAAAKDLVVETRLADDYGAATLTVKDENGRTLLEKTYEKPGLWSCETPNLYYETVRTEGGDYRAVAVGFRKIEIRDAVLYINGKRALFMGTNRHEMEPGTGYTVTREGMMKDIEVFRDLNINAVRTSHYPNDPFWYELCDREGVYVVCEANIEAHGTGIYGDQKDVLPRNPLYHDAIVERGVNMVKTFRNHPSIIFWSLGNESGSGQAMKDEYAAMKAVDATRPVQYEGMQDDDAASDIKCPMYFRPWIVEDYLRNVHKKPYIHCEYSHAMGNSNGGIQKYWDLVRKYPSAQGGFIWDFADQALWKADARGKWLAYGGDFGDRPNDDNFNCNGFVDPLRNYHPGAYEIKHAYQPVHVDAWDWATKTAKIRNDYRFSDLSGLNGHWVVTKAGAIVRDGVLDLAGFAPDTEKDFAIPDAPDGDAITFLFVRGAFDPNGRPDVVAHDQFVKPFVAPEFKPFDGKAVAEHPFRVNFWRAPVDNDRGWDMPAKCKVWKVATAAQRAPEGAESKLEVQKSADGKYLVTLTLKADAKLPVIPRVGVTFTIPKDLVNVEWYGLGPWENYPDRRTAALLDDWKATIGLVNGLADASGSLAYPEYRLNPDNYIEPGEQGYRTGCRMVAFGDGKGKSVRVTALNAPFGFNAWPYSQEKLEQAKHQWDLVADDFITVNIDAAMMGIGGDDSWGSLPHDDVMLKGGEYRLEFLVEGL